MLHSEILRPEADALFDVLGAAPELKGLTLMGGTALALQLGHRISLDFDFAMFDGTLPARALDQLIARLKSEGHQTQMITAPTQISQFKINTGLNLLDYARDYVIDGVKVTFFVHSKNELQKEYYQSAPRVMLEGFAFDLLDLEGLKVAKTLVLADRVRSRDLYDLYILMRESGYDLKSFFENIKSLGTVDDPEYYKAILRGETPLDTDDEGLEAVELEDGYQKMYDYFRAALDEYETDLAKAHFISHSLKRD